MTKPIERLPQNDAERRRLASLKRLETMRERYDSYSVDRIKMRVTDWQRDGDGNRFRLIYAE
jgi:hypothetical protein